LKVVELAYLMADQSGRLKVDWKVDEWERRLAGHWVGTLVDLMAAMRVAWKVGMLVVEMAGRKAVSKGLPKVGYLVG
jgi:hypothetical protein